MEILYSGLKSNILRLYTIILIFTNSFSLNPPTQKLHENPERRLEIKNKRLSLENILTFQVKFPGFCCSFSRFKNYPVNILIVSKVVCAENVNLFYLQMIAGIEMNKLFLGK